MIIHAKLILFVICVVEIIIKFNLFLKFKISKNLIIRLLRLFKLKKVSDTWKEKVLFYYTKKIFQISLQIILIFLIILLLYSLLIYIDFSINKYLFSIIGLLEVTIIALIYYKIRKFIK